MNKTEIIGHTHLKFKELPSTNKYAMEYISNNRPMEGTVISADFQSEGQGQIGRNWHSEAGSNVLVSLIFRPTFIKPIDQFVFNQAIALGVRNAVAHFLDKRVWIKWPNDIYVTDQKIAGILIQNIIDSTKISYSVVGVGLNVNQKVFPKHIPNPTSLSILKNTSFDKANVLQVLFEQIGSEYVLLKASKTKLINQHYHQNLLGINKSMRFGHNEKVFYGMIKGVDKQGKLIIEKENETSSYQFGEIRFLDFQKEE